MTVKHTLVSLDMRVFALCSLMELHRGEKARACREAVCPLRYRQGRHHLRHGADAGISGDYSGRYQHHHECSRLRRRSGNGITGRDRDGH